MYIQIFFQTTKKPTYPRNGIQRPRNGRFYPRNKILPYKSKKFRLPISLDFPPSCQVSQSQKSTESICAVVSPAAVA